MSRYANFDTGEQFQVASNKGWGDVVTWSETLDADDFPQIVHLCEHGWSQNIPALVNQLKTALAKHRPDDSVVSSVRGLISGIAEVSLGKTGATKATTVIVSDGTGPD